MADYQARCTKGSASRCIMGSALNIQEEKIQEEKNQNKNFSREKFLCGSRIKRRRNLRPEKMDFSSSPRRGKAEDSAPRPFYFGMIGG